MINTKKPGHLFSNVHFSRTMLMAAAVVLIMITAAVFVYANGNSQTIAVNEGTGEKQSEISEDTSSGNETRQMIYVDVGGCVKKPGVYEVPHGSRVFEVIEKAGGVTQDADLSGINQAETVTDGMKITVPSHSENSSKSSHADAEGQTGSSSGNGLININTADSETLQQISGVGPATAEKIISYREANGPFTSIEELTSVNGIGEKTFQKMKDQITC